MQDFYYISEIIAFLALILSGYAAYRTNKLDNLIIAKHKKEEEDSKKANVSAEIVQVNSRRNHLEIFNSGPVTAKNVNIEIEDKQSLEFDDEQVKEIFPLQALEPLKSIEVIAMIHPGSVAKCNIRIVWDDDFAYGREETFHLVVSA